jgi:hypothetical protein
MAPDDTPALASRAKRATRKIGILVLARARFYAGAGKGAQDAVNEAARAVNHGRGSVSSHEMCSRGFLTRLEFADSGSEAGHRPVNLLVAEVSLAVHVYNLCLLVSNRNARLS